MKKLYLFFVMLIAILVCPQKTTAAAFEEGIYTIQNQETKQYLTSEKLAVKSRKKPSKKCQWYIYRGLEEEKSKKNYVIQWGKSRICLDVERADVKRGNVLAYQKGGDKNQCWQFKKVKGNTYYIQSALNAKYVLAWEHGKLTIQKKKSGKKSQKWIIKKKKTYKMSTQKVKSIKSGKVYTIQNASQSKKYVYAKDGQIGLAKTMDAYYDLWRVNVSPNDSSYFEIYSYHQRRCLDIYVGQIDANKKSSSVCLYDRYFTDNQSWKFEKAGENQFYIVSKLNNQYVLALADGKMVVQKKTGSKNQKWMLEDQTSFLEKTIIKSYKVSEYFGEKEKNAEKAIADAAKNLKSFVDLKPYKLKANQCEEMMFVGSYFVNDYPEIFYVKDMQLVEENGYYTKALITYNGDEKTINKQKKEIEEIEKDFLGHASSNWTEVEKALYVYQYILANVDYVDGGNLHTTMVGGRGVCWEYANLYKELGNLLGLQVVRMGGDELHHAWIAVKIGEQFYMADPTWGDQYVPTNTEFLVSSIQLHENHDAKSWTFFNPSYNGKNVTNSQLYDNLFIKHRQTGFAYVDGYWYAVDNTKQMLCKYTFKNNRFVEVEEIDSVAGYVGSVAAYNGTLYYTKWNEGVYAYHPDKKKKERYLSLSDSCMKKSGYSINGISSLRINRKGELYVYPEYTNGSQEESTEKAKGRFACQLQ